MSLLSQVTVSAVGLFSKALLNVGFCSSVTVKGLDNLLKALEDDERNNGRGIVTMSNHISTLDDPVVWGVLPARFYRDSRRTRWTLGASDIMFTNPVFSTFFRYGQVVETFRGKGIFQPAIDTAIEKLNRGEWIHLFGEGKVNQDSGDFGNPNAGRLLRFKWGIGRIMMEAQKPPVIIPMWLTGFDKLMPEGRSAPFKFFPRPGAALSITFGKPVPSQDIQNALSTLVREGRMPEAPTPPSTSGGLADLQRPQEEERSGSVAEHGWLGASVSQALHDDAEPDKAHEVARVRSAVTAVIQREVEALGREVMTLR
ncbi:acyltransferase-domain-containing protein [Lentinus tigrinus ALCF2SS1-7]|uniref:Tafazzin family protein n=1 Tax=Lentinus tigrinus ALCF2SS1-6 TaxID=1328759 RepID=A0A5C2S0J3_9APHY|nr:acyltransferase-domain-containing protein [Lentinus tigrinus ALCF2SS1-6]RPD71174.1 acyltransferase-domain-containing protein [Lentinus tigrinus ALCF2SS1-7]